MSQETNKSVLTAFESLGANCEFGFVQERLGADVSTIFRWSEIPSIKALIDAVRSDFIDLYHFENLEPFNAGMVRDKASGIAWHSTIRSELIDSALPPYPENFRFTKSVEERKGLYDREIVKVRYLISKTRESLATGDRIFVYKSLRNKPVSIEELTELRDALNERHSSELLHVTVAREPSHVGRVDIAKARLMIGYVDRFAPGNNARDISLEAWAKVCGNALSISKSQDLR